MPRRWLWALILVGGSTLAGLFVAEVGVRIVDDEVGVFTWRNFAESKLNLFSSAYPAAHDPDLGWTPRPGYRGDDNVWKTIVSIDDDGLRNNGQPRPKGKPIVVVGDSFAFGDEVSDNQTLPAALERATGRPVLNGGVFGYGFDQSVIRAHKLVARHNPDFVVIQLVKDDIHRAMMSVRTGVEKPYFVLQDNLLVTKNVPASPMRPSISDVGLFRKVAGYSYLVDWSMRRTGRGDWWYVGNWPSKLAYNDIHLAARTCCRALQRLDDELDAKGIRAILVAEYGANTLTAVATHPDLRPIQALMQCARDRGIAVIDTFEIFKDVGATDPARLSGLYLQVHYSQAGNEFVADLIKAAL